MKKLLCVLMAFALAFSMVACSTEGPAEEKEVAATTAESVEKATTDEKEGPLKVGLSFVSLSFPYYVRMYDAFMEQGAAKGWEISFVDGNLDAATQVNGLSDLLNEGIDVLVVSTWYIEAMVDIFDQCAQKDIPVFVIGNMNNPEEIDKNIVYACGTDHYDAGFLGGKWTSGYLKNEGKDSVNMVVMAGITKEMKQRAQGFIDAMEENGVTVNVLNQYDATSREDAMAAMEDALTAYNNIELVYGVSAQGALGAYDATVGAKRTEVMVVGYDGEDEELELIDKKLNYIGTISQNPALEASTTADYVSKYLAGETFEKNVPIPAGIYCAEGQLTQDEVLAS